MLAMPHVSCPVVDSSWMIAITSAAPSSSHIRALVAPVVVRHLVCNEGWGLIGFVAAIVFVEVRMRRHISLRQG